MFHSRCSTHSGPLPLLFAKGFGKLEPAALSSYLRNYGRRSHSKSRIGLDGSCNTSAVFNQDSLPTEQWKTYSFRVFSPDFQSFKSPIILGMLLSLPGIVIVVLSSLGSSHHVDGCLIPIQNLVLSDPYFFEHFRKVIISSIGLTVQKPSVTQNYWSFFKFLKGFCYVFNVVLQVILQSHEINLEQLDLSGLELGQIQSQSCSADDGGSLRYDEERGSQFFERVIDTVDALALATATMLIKLSTGRP